MRNQVDFLHVNRHQNSLQGATVVLVWASRLAYSTQNNQIKISYWARKRWEIDLIFCIKINIKVSSKQIQSFSVVLARHDQSTQANKFAISLQCIKKEWRHEVDFLHAYKKSFLQVDSINVNEYGQPRRKYSK